MLRTGITRIRVVIVQVIIPKPVVRIVGVGIIARVPRIEAVAKAPTAEDGVYPTGVSEGEPKIIVAPEVFESDSKTGTPEMARPMKSAPDWKTHSWSSDARMMKTSTTNTWPAEACVTKTSAVETGYRHGVAHGTAPHTAAALSKRGSAEECRGQHRNRDHAVHKGHL